jgi:hypothetical protein
MQSQLALGGSIMSEAAPEKKKDTKLLWSFIFVIAMMLGALTQLDDAMSGTGMFCLFAAFAAGYVACKNIVGRYETKDAKFFWSLVFVIVTLWGAYIPVIDNLAVGFQEGFLCMLAAFAAGYVAARPLFFIPCAKP